MQYEGKDLTFQDHMVPSADLLISPEECAQLIAQGATGYLLLPTAEDEIQETAADRKSTRLNSSHPV